MLNQIDQTVQNVGGAVKREPIRLAILVEALILLGPLVCLIVVGSLFELITILSLISEPSNADPWPLENEVLRSMAIAFPFGLFALIQLLRLTLYNVRNRLYKFRIMFWIAMACGVGCSAVLMNAGGMAPMGFLFVVLPASSFAVHMIYLQVSATSDAYHAAVLAIEQREKGETISRRCPRCNSLFEVRRMPGKTATSTIWIASCKC